SEAAAHLAQALDRCAPDRRLAIQSRLARQLRIAGDHAGAVENAAEALKGYEAAGDLLAAAAPAEDLTLALVYGDGDLDRAENVVREQLARIPDTREFLNTRIGLTTALAAVVLRQHDPAELKRLGEESMHLAEISGDPRLIADSWITYALSAVTDGLPQLAVTLLERAAELAGEHRALRVRGIALVNLAGFATFENLTLGVRGARDACATGRELGDTYLSSFAGANLALALLLDGNWDEALALASADDLRTHMPIESRIFRRLIRSGRGEPTTDEVVGDDDERDLESRELIDRALEAREAGAADAVGLAISGARRALGEATADELWFGWLLASEIIHELGDDGTRAEVLALVEDENRPWPASVRSQRARLRAAVGAAGSLSDQVVEECFTEAVDTARAWGSPLFEAHARADYGSWLLARGREAEGADQTGRARAFYEQVGATRWLAALDARSAR
ncbi:hypothetical protein, partial [Marmoricola sp. RAF53]|uniref:hypothetical protein n=1 Tax=Marmoricola sp. RAF53 TaxID=3233059 RepID=UPI003F955C3B